ncbi:hypothetical protein CRYUN_Cryun30bG0089700 [Craigia yunnanensis]
MGRGDFGEAKVGFWSLSDLVGNWGMQQSTAVLGFDMSFPVVRFNLADYKLISILCSFELAILDVIGQIISIGKEGTTTVGRTYQEVIKRNLEIRISEEDTITVTLWADFAQQLLDEDLLYKDEAPIVIFAAVTVSKYMRKLTIATCSASRIIVNPDIPEATELKQRLDLQKNQVQLLQSSASTRLPPEEQKKQNRKTIKQLLNLNPPEAMVKILHFSI